jgi:hypothetical protein
VAPDGALRFIHSDAAAELVSAVGVPVAKRASHVEPDPLTGEWVVDMSPSGGPAEIGRWPAHQRDKALAAEVAWLEEHVLKINEEAQHARTEDGGRNTREVPESD